MFKKAPYELKTSAPIRGSDRRKLKAQVVEAFQLNSDADWLVPEGLQARKYSSSAKEPGTLYLSPDGEPLFFTVGKGSSTLIPTLYTLWKRRGLVPLLSTSNAVVEKLIGGADLMIPGIAESEDELPRLAAGELVGVAIAGTDVPLAIGTMAVDSSALRDGMKGKAVLTLHTYRDHLWEMGSKPNPPSGLPEMDDAAVDPVIDSATDVDQMHLHDGPIANNGASGMESDDRPASSSIPIGDDADKPAQLVKPSLPPSEVDAILRRALIHSIASNLSQLPPSAFPILGTTLYTSHILPSRPSTAPPTADIKHSSFKKLAKFLKAAEKDGLVKLKDVKGESWLTAVNAAHEEVAAHRGYKTLADAERKEANRKDQEKQQEQKLKKDGMPVVELYKPLGPSVGFYTTMRKSTDDLYTAVDVRGLLLEYVKEHSLIHPREPSYILLDEVLQRLLLKKDEQVEFLRRDEAIDRLKGKMQPWYSLTSNEAEPPIVKKGQLNPISAIAKTRQGRRVTTLVTDFEPFGIAADALSEELRKLCASATSVTTLPGKTSASEVLVQGKQLKIVQDLLLSKGVPKKWIHTEDLTGKK